MCEVVNIGNLTFLFSPLQNIETASLGVFLRVGSRFEQKRVKGIAHFLEHVVFKGSKNYSHLKIKREIEGRGGSLNAFTSQEITAYYAHFLNKNLSPALDILMDMVCNPLLKDADINKERNVILEEIKMYRDLPPMRATTLLDELLWAGHPLGEDIIGSTQTVKKIGALDLKAFKDKYYGFPNMVVSFSGNFPREKIIKRLEKLSCRNQGKVILKTKAPLPCSKVSVKTETRNIEQTHLCLGFRSVSYLSKERLVAQLINIILGANMSSRLFEELREKKSLCYDISTEIKKYKDSGAFIVHTGLDKAKVKEAIVTVLRELIRIKESKVSLSELSRAKDYLLGQIAMNLERPQGRMFYAAENYITLGKVFCFDSIRKEVNSITPLQIKKLACDVFRFDHLCISCVGNIDKNYEFEIKKAVEKGGSHP